MDGKVGGKNGKDGRGICHVQTVMSATAVE